MKKTLILLSVALAMFASFAHADAIKFATGKAGKGYSPLFADINSVCGSQVSLQEVNTEGGLDNISALTEKTATLGLAPADVLQTLEKTDSSIGRLKAVASLNNNLLHIVTLKAGFKAGNQCKGTVISGKCVGFQGDAIIKTIETQADLEGLTVGLVGSAKITGRTYVAGKVPFTPMDFSDDKEALAALRAGTIQAYLTMAAWPSSVISGLPANSGVKLAAWTLKKDGVYGVSTKNYKNLGQFGTPFLMVPNLIMARPVDPSSEAGKNITKLRSCIASNLGRFKDQDGFVPSWDEVSSIKTPDDIPAWSGK
jgi:TRAP-type uncharacterized transport system substrate-binding protein